MSGQLTQEQVDQLEATHGKVRAYKITLPGGAVETFVFKFPTRPQYQMWRAAEKKEDPEAQERLVIGMCVSHTRDQFFSVLDAPGNAALADVLAGKLGEWINPKLEEEGKG